MGEVFDHVDGQGPGDHVDTHGGSNEPHGDRVALGDLTSSPKADGGHAGGRDAANEDELEAHVCSLARG